MLSCGDGIVKKSIDWDADNVLFSGFAEHNFKHSESFSWFITGFLIYRLMKLEKYIVTNMG